MADSPELWIPFGKLSRPHGVRGELRLTHHNSAEIFPQAVTRLRLQRPGAAPRLVEVTGSRAVNNGTLVRLEGVSDRDQAAALGGVEVEIAATDLPALAEGELYLHELIGARASDEEGRELGVVQQIADNLGQDLIVLRGPAGDLLVPISEETVQSLDRERRQVVLRVPVGLLEPEDG